MGLAAKEKMLGNIPKIKKKKSEMIYRTVPVKRRSSAPQPGDLDFMGPVQKPTDFEMRRKAAFLKLPVSVVKTIDRQQEKKQRYILSKDVLKTVIRSTRPGADTTQKTIAMLALREMGKGTKEPLEVAKEKVLRRKAEEMTIQEWAAQQPGPHPVYVPSSEYGTYDVVRSGYPVEDKSGKIVPGYLFEYSPKSKHMIEIAGSIENYKKYLKEVRSKQFLPIVNAILGKSLNIDLALASNVPGITGASEREEILIQLLRTYKGSPEGGFEPGRFAVGAVQSPFVQLPISFGVGSVVGKVGGRVTGYLAAKYGPRAVQAFNVAQLAAGGALTYPKAKSIADKAAKGKTGKAAEEAVILALLVSAGIAGYRSGRSSQVIFGKYKGLTQFEAGFKKGLVKSKLFDPLQKEYYSIISEIKQDLRLRKVVPVQEEPTYTNVKALKQYNQQKADILRTVIRNQLISLKNRAQISGGAGTEKPSTHDIDQLFRSAKDPVVLEYIARKLGIDPNQVFDPHQLPRIGALVKLTGATKESPYVYPSGQRGIRFTEQFYRLAESGGQLAHKGRIKDIPEAVRILNLIYSKTGGIPKNMQPKVQRFLEISTILEQDPRLMNPAMSKLLYDSGIGKKLWNVRTKFYQKLLPQAYLKKQFGALSKSDLAKLQNFVNTQASGGLPPSLSMAFSDSPYMMGSWAMFFRNLASRSESPGYSGQPSIPGYPPKPSKPPYVRTTPSSYPHYPDSRSYTPSTKDPSTSLSPPPSDSPYIPSSEQPSPYPYYPEYGSYPTYPEDPPPPGLFFFPGMGGRVAGRGRAKPFGVRYYNEYEAVQRLMRNVVF